MYGDLRVAIIHYWIVNWRGGEKVLEALCELFPTADIFTLIVDPQILPSSLKKHRIVASWIQHIPGARKFYQSLLPLYPIALEQIDLTDYDLVISSESGPAKGVLTRPETCHICYCHTPMRYLWDMYHDYQKGAGPLKRLLMPPLMNYLRIWDLATAQRVDYFIANSQHVARRIAKHYRREAVVVFPPVAVDDFAWGGEPEDFYLMVGQLVSYKKADLAVEAFNQSGRNLVVIGEGRDLSSLRKLARPNIRFLGRQPFSVIRDHYARCKAFIFPGEEDFGITPVEAQASGRPVIALRCGGALETVIENETGLFFNEPTADSLNEAIQRFESGVELFPPARIREHSLKFDRTRFLREMEVTINCFTKEHFERFRG